MLLQSCIDCLLSGQYEMKWRARHSTIVSSHRLYSWGGQQEDLPMVHYNDEKRKFTSSIDFFNFPILTWERRSTTATPPAGVMNYACTNIRDSILYFGVNLTTVFIMIYLNWTFLLMNGEKLLTVLLMMDQ